MRETIFSFHLKQQREIGGVESLKISQEIEILNIFYKLQITFVVYFQFNHRELLSVKRKTWRFSHKSTLNFIIFYDEKLIYIYIYLQKKCELDTEHFILFNTASLHRKNQIFIRYVNQIKHILLRGVSWKIVQGIFSR